MITFNDIKKRVKISVYLATQNIKVTNGRCVATWRGGKRDSVVIDDTEGVWCDHGNNNEGGDLFKLVQEVEGLSVAQAAKALRERFNIQEEQKSKVVATYDYKDENGKPIFCVIRKEPKDFRQAHYDENGKLIHNMKDVRLVPYHLPQLIEGVQKNVRIFIGEGEKDVENMEKLGLVATCNAGGAGKWRDEYSAFFKGAEIVTIIADRDGAEKDYPGQRHAEQVRESLERVAGVKASIVYVGNATCKDASDWIKAGATADDFNALADNPPKWENPLGEPEPPVEDEASASQDPLLDKEEAMRKKREVAKKRKEIFARHRQEKFITNYDEEKLGETSYYFARSSKAVLDELFALTLDEDGDGWPRLLGTVPFVFNKDKHNPAQRFANKPDATALFGWIHDSVGLKWKSANGGAQDSNGMNFITKAEFFANLLDRAKSYEGISEAPHYPPRKDQFYDFGELPPPSEGHRVFWELVDGFCPADEVYRLLLAAFLLAPLFNGEHPLWVIGTVDSQGSGKSSVVEISSFITARLNDEKDKPPMFDYSWPEIVKDPDRIKRQLVSTEGRRLRIFRIDNVTGEVANDTLDSWVTAGSYTGMKQYGKGVESRPNDLTWVITTNGAKLDDDTVSRAYTIKVRKRPADKPYQARYTGFSGRPLVWKEDQKRYIVENLHQLHADMLDMMKNAPYRKTDGRFEDFDATVLSAVCESDGEFFELRARINADGRKANVNRELGEELTELVKGFCAEMPAYDDKFDARHLVLLSMRVLAYLRNASNNERLKKMNSAEVYELLRTGLAPDFSQKFSQLASSHGSPRPPCVAFGLGLIPPEATSVKYQLIDLVLNEGSLVPKVVRPVQEGEFVNVRALI